MQVSWQVTSLYMDCIKSSLRSDLSPWEWLLSIYSNKKSNSVIIFHTDGFKLLPSHNNGANYAPGSLHSFRNSVQISLSCTDLSQHNITAEFYVKFFGPHGLVFSQ